jgi:hypothetical protein
MTKSAFKIQYALKCIGLPLMPDDVAKRAEETWESMFFGKRCVWTDDSDLVHEIFTEKERLEKIVESMKKVSTN